MNFLNIFDKLPLVILEKILLYDNIEKISQLRYISKCFNNVYKNIKREEYDIYQLTNYLNKKLYFDAIYIEFNNVFWKLKRYLIKYPNTNRPPVINIKINRKDNNNNMTLSRNIELNISTYLQCGLYNCISPKDIKILSI